MAMVQKVWQREVEVHAAETGLVIGGDEMKHRCGVDPRREEQQGDA